MTRFRSHKIKKNIALFYGINNIKLNIYFFNSTNNYIHNKHDIVHA